MKQRLCGCFRNKYYMAILLVDWMCNQHADRPILVDRSPPVAGEVYDGPEMMIDWQFQSSDKLICSNWHNFYDPQSGIGLNNFIIAMVYQPQL